MLKNFYSRALPILMATLFFTSASAESFKVNGVNYSTVESYPGYEKAVVMTSCDDTISHLKIPQSVNGYTVVGINNGACYKMTKLAKVTLPATIGSISASAFAQCSNLAEINLPPAINFIGDEAFDYSGLTSVEFTSEGVVSIRPKAFHRCKNLKSVKLPKLLPAISNSLFENCTSLQSITIPETVTSIGDAAFNGCFAFKSINIPDAVTTIGKMAICNCVALEEVTLGKGVKDIDGITFWMSDNIKRLYVKWTENPTALDEELGKINKDQCTLYVPNGTTSIYKKTTPWSSFTNIKEYEYSGVGEVAADRHFDNAVYTIDGRVVKTNAAGVDGLDSGVYIYNGKKIVVR